MSFLNRWFKKKEPEDYETILSSLALDIQNRQTRLSEIRLRERRTSLAVTLYSIALWGLYMGLWYTGLLPRRRRYGQLEKTLQALPVFLGPIIILFGRRIVQLWYTRKGDAEEQALKKLYKEQRDKIEDIKKKTNYYSTRNLIERYDEAPAAESPLRRRGPQQPPATPQQRGSPQQQGTPAAAPNAPQTPIPSRLQTQLNPAAPQFPLQPPQKQWYDKLADALLGADEPSVNAAASQYALICEKCFTHNGLVKESMWEDAQFICPKCGHFNPSARSRKQGGLSPSQPKTPQAAQPQSARSPIAPSSLRESPERPADRSVELSEGPSMRMDIDS
ncbi:hypothetical protein DENSPDRAFT_841744 [Dentipellis sp. KUC8613]|nr:hypothetical protein DENSPDRAFT_841744 [Dentipellis sp. KUC8613]